MTVSRSAARERIRYALARLINEDPVWAEPEIIINGTSLTTAQAETIRVALQTFALGLRHDGLGEDEAGKDLTKGYLAAIHMINVLMQR